MPSESGGDNSQAASENEDAKITSESPSTGPGLKRHGEIDWRKWGMGAASMKLGLTEDRFRCKISRLKAACHDHINPKFISGRCQPSIRGVQEGKEARS